MTEVKHNAIKYPSTAQFRNVVQHIKNIYQYKGLDDEGNPIIDQTVELPKIEYQGTVKIHGTNGSLVMFEDGKIYCQSKERMLAFGCDNAGFWEAMQYVDLNNLFDIVKKDYYAANGVEATYPIIISGEWAGCFSYGTPILLEDGSTLPIGKIVNQKLNVNVMSYNIELGRLEARKITNWFHNGSTDNWIRINYKRRKRGGNACGVTVTPNHIFYRKLNNQMVEAFANDLVVGDTIYITGSALGHKPLQFIMGSLLGDGSFLGKRHYKVSHSTKQSFYTTYINKMLVGSLYKSISGFGADLDVFTSMAYPEIEDLYDELYRPNGVSKEPTRKYLDKLGPLALAVWYMDDGSLIDQTKNNRQYACDLHTQGFTEETNTIIADFLNERGYECYMFHTRTKSNGQEGYSIRFTPRGCSSFLEDIAPYILEEFNYKLPPLLRLLPKIDVFVNYFEYEQPLLETTITDINKDYKPKILTKYDLEVEGNHNYFANNILVHNSNIQKSVAVNGLHKFFCIFGVKVGDYWQPIDDYTDLKDNENYIFNSLQFETYSIVIDFNNPLDIQNKLIEITEAVEAECPVGKFFGNIGVGEGCVYKPRDRGLVADSGSWYKVKGDKHSSSKVKKLASVDTEKLESIKEFVEYACTESRLEQGIQEVGLDIKLVGEYIGWINRDIFKEEADTLKANNLEMKDCGRDISNIARKFYLNKINENV
ncbi:intein-containing RNA ligase [Pseudaeromonas phage vB_PpeM_ KLEP7]|nr:intein-containing RNA ligase [Pseudaeromonas phage vB_PpeM_ KLEP7]